MNKVLWTSVVGSHAWGMERPDSDWDFFEVYQAPTREFLLGRTHSGGHESHGLYHDGVVWDKTSSEIGHFVNQIMKGNINFIIALMAPTTEPGTVLRGFRYQRNGTGTIARVHAELQDIFRANLAKNIFPSTAGMVASNLNKYFTPGKDSFLDSQSVTRLENGTIGIDPLVRRRRAKKLGQLDRMIQLGIRLLMEHRVELSPVPVGDGGPEHEDRTRWWLEVLQTSYKASSLPEKPDAGPYEEFLLKLRKD